MLTSIKWLFFPFITGICYVNRNNIKLIFISSTINSLYVFSKIQIKYKQISSHIYPRITSYETPKNNLVVLINGKFIKLISDNSFYKKNNIYLAINDTFDCTTYTFIDVSVEYNNKLYPILLKTKEYNFYISGNIIDKYFIQYYLEHFCDGYVGNNEIEYKLTIIDDNADLILLTQKDVITLNKMNYVLE